MLSLCQPVPAECIKYSWIPNPQATGALDTDHAYPKQSLKCEASSNRSNDCLQNLTWVIPEELAQHRLGVGTWLQRGLLDRNSLFMQQEF